MRINIAKYPVFMKLGYFPRERIMGQEMLVSLCAEFQLPIHERVGDVLEKSLDYGKVLRAIDEVLRDREMKLIETAVERLAESLMQMFVRIETLHLKIEKPILPDGMGKGAAVSVSETYVRGASGACVSAVGPSSGSVI